jgi:flavin-dependent thymidylate synthase
MKLFEKPRVELVGRQVLDIEGLIRFLDENDRVWPELRNKLDSNMDLGDKDPLWILESAGRGCYMSYDGKGRDHASHIKHLIEVGHFSVLEHAVFNFHIWGISRSLSHELVRHRIASYSQLSQRYVDSSDCAFVVPPAIQELKEKEPIYYATWIAHMERSRELYSKFTEVLGNMYKDIEDKVEKRKKSRQAARSVLPNATETKIFVTMNGRSLRHFLSVQMYKIIKREFDLIVYGIDLTILEDGTEALVNHFTET